MIFIHFYVHIHGVGGIVVVVVRLIIGVGVLVLHEFKPEHIWFNDTVSSQNVLWKHVFSPEQTIITSPSFEQIFKSRHELSDIQSILIVCVRVP